MAGYRKRRGKKAPRVDDLFYGDPDQEPVDQPSGAAGHDHAGPDAAGGGDGGDGRDGADADAGDDDAAMETDRRRRRARWAASLPWLRAVAVVGVAGALVYGAGLPQVRPVDAEQVLNLPRAAEVEPVQDAGLSLVTDHLVVCPGAELVGLDDPTVAEPEQVVQVWGSAAPEEALPEGVPEQALSAPGTVSVDRSDDTTRDTTERGGLAYMLTSGDRWVGVRGEGALAAGVAGGQVHLGLEEQQRGLSAAPCVPAQEETWLVAGGSEPGRVERLLLVNPTGNPVTADVEILGADGPVDVVGGRGVVVPAGGRHVVLLDALAPGEERPVVHVHTTGGPLMTMLGDRWLEGTVDRGLELVTPTALPATEQVIPAVSAPREDTADGATVRVGVPGAEAAIVQLRALTADGPVRVDNDVTTVPAGAVSDIDVADLPEGTHGIEIVADVPVVAAAHTERRDDPDGPGDLAWVPAAAPTGGLLGSVLARQGADEPAEDEPGSAYSRVLSVASASGATVSVTTVSDGAVTTEELDVPAAGTSTLELAHEVDSVWVRPTEGEVSAGVVTEVADDAGPMVAGMVLPQVPLTQQVRGVAPWTP